MPLQHNYNCFGVIWLPCDDAMFPFLIFTVLVNVEGQMTDAVKKFRVETHNEPIGRNECLILRLPVAIGL